MPELPEVEVLTRNLRRRVVQQRIEAVRVFRARSLRGASASRMGRALRGKRIASLTRRAKYLRFDLDGGGTFLVHLGMTGRLYLSRRSRSAHDKHDIAHLRLEAGTLVFHDPRKFGRLTLGDTPLHRLGPEPLGGEFTGAYLAERLRTSRAPIKVRLLDQKLVAGLGNIYACEALWRARIDPRCQCRNLRAPQVAALRKAIVATLRDAIRFGGGMSLQFGSAAPGNGLFYYGSGARRNNPAEHFAVYDREGKPCRRCGQPIARIVQGGRSTFFCERCQRKT